MISHVCAVLGRSALRVVLGVSALALFASACASPAPSPAPTLPSGERPEDLLAASRRAMDEASSFTFTGTLRMEPTGQSPVTMRVFGQYARYAEEGYDEGYYRYDTEGDERFQESIVVNGKRWVRSWSLPGPALPVDWERGEDVEARSLAPDELPEGYVVTFGEETTLEGVPVYRVVVTGEPDRGAGQATVVHYIDKETMLLRRLVSDATVTERGESASVHLTVDFSGYGETMVTRRPEGCETLPCLPPVMYRPESFARECRDFPTWLDAYLFMHEAQRAGVDRHDLDIDDRGSPCNDLPGAPGPDEPLPVFL